MSAITWSSTNFSGAPDDEDRRAAHFLIRVENARRAALDPPGTPLPSSTGAELKASTLTVMDQILTNAWTSYVQQAAGDKTGANEDDWKAIKAAIRSRLDNGEAIANIITDVTS